MPCARGVDEQGGLTVTCVSNYASPGRTSAENKREVSRAWRQPTIISLCIARVFVLRVVQRASSYHATSKNIRERVHGIITRRPFLCLLDPWLISLSLLPSSLHFHSFFSFFDLINQGIRGENERISDRRNDDGGDELSSMHKERARSRVFRPRNSGRRESLIITLGINSAGKSVNYSRERPTLGISVIIPVEQIFRWKKDWMFAACRWIPLKIRENDIFLQNLLARNEKEKKK